MKKIVAINLGSTSTKIAYYEDENCVFKDNIKHSPEELNDFATIWDQQDYRTEKIVNYLNEKGIHISGLDAVVTRGGHTEPIVGGVYRVSEKMLEQSGSEKYGNHATDVGLRIVKEFSKQGPQAFTVDPPTTDEFEPLARYSGIPFIERRSSFHVLNHRAAGMQYAKDIGKNYEDLNLVVVHMGGGISIAAHKKGKLVDANNAIDGDGPFSTNRCCTVPIGDLIKLCYSGDYTYPKIRKLINGQSGLMGYVGENDAKIVQDRALAGDAKCKEVMEAMCYQIAKEIGADATVLKGKVDAIVFTGGMAYSDWIVGMVSDYVGYIAPIAVYPGEYEMQSLALNTLAALNGEKEIRELK
ncbi:butyrate kinase [Diplocloster agilis]|uniref:Probable butyrate kinase n=1 Tax=Diplocloster agilis TaxID=2850323 RepID=A0A949JXX3_9FIRM|nr:MULTISPECIES: butyrate kinase [Lachnospiraceae]MBU9737228.1 butyrate kinase [Diplocloster agilis]MBU9746449.1 butyrate kinase [Diplocloster agilis]MCU6736186.1 butyrate kinase [Suonthocola fibrivorans]SCJ87421.1 Butyrate kinase 2 [uncultured Clostridium sp.]